MLLLVRKHRLALSESTRLADPLLYVTASSCFSGFSHPLFKRDQEELSYMIKPKPGKVRDRSAAAVAARKAKQDTDAPSPVAGALEPPTSLSARPNDIYKSDPGRMVSGGNSSIGPGGSGSNGSQPKGVRRSKRFVSEQQQQQPLEHSDGFEPDMSSSQVRQFVFGLLRNYVCISVLTCSLDRS